MGWSFTTQPLPRSIKTADHVAAMFNLTSSEGERQEVVAKKQVGSTVYLALRVTPPKGKGKPYVTAVVVLTKRGKGGFGHKSMDEMMGPAESKCPAEILRILSPVSALPHPEFAHRWRQRCRDHHQWQEA